MKTIIPVVIIFSVLLLIPLGYQSVSAGLTNNLGGTFGPNGAPSVPANGGPVPPVPVFPSGPGDYFLINDVVFDPFGYIQEKHFIDPVLGPNLITEQINNNGIYAIFDWHEEIQTPDALWIDPLNTGVSVCGAGPLPPSAYIISTDFNQGLWIDFDPPILPGECIQIDKSFQLSASIPFVPIIEYPTGKDLDFGDLDEPPFPTTIGPPVVDGARHVIVPGINMGILIDAEFDGQPNALATGDDIAGAADEDGFTGASLVLGGAPTDISVTTTGGGIVHVFMSQGGAPLTFVGSAPAMPLTTVPVDLVTPGFSAGPVDTRIRHCSPDDCGTPTGLSLSGEVEDYILTITDPVPPPMCPPGTTGTPPNCITPPGPNPVGGTGIPISTTSLLLAGLDSNYSILMALAVIGFGAFGALYYSTKKKSEES